ncbi:MAG: DUF885 domain-containing protein, partial [Thermoanaerobaculia bacterium]|nr:DUF885 domain-containing protein [Thermoanaerobaculia bacterium]
MRSIAKALLLSALAAASVAAAPPPDELDVLAREFWTWRAIHQPVSGDDIPRLERPAAWRPDWSRATIDRRIGDLAAFEARWRALDTAGWSVARSVDHRLVGAALARARWELVVAPAWRTNPLFYVDQTLAALFESLLEPPPFDAARAERVLAVLASMPQTAADARANLDDARAPFSRLAV